MGKMLAKTDVGWVAGVPYVRLASGWARVKKGYRKTSSVTWSQFLTVDSSPPAVPIITEFEKYDDKLRITIKAPADSDVAVLRVKVGKRIAANIETDSDYVSSPDGTDVAWSEWSVAPGQTRTKYYPVSGTLTSNTTYYVTVWAQDTSKNYSNPATASAKFTTPTTPNPGSKSASISCTDSATFKRTSKTWTEDDDHPDVGSTTDRVGVFFYNSKISAQLKNATRLNRVQIRLQRLNGSGYKGVAQVKLLAHTMTGYSKVDLDSGGRIVYRDTTVRLVNQGETVTFDVPEEWYPDILSGKIKGFGLYSQASSGDETIDPYVASFYGDGTSSGKVTLEYEE